MRPFSRRGIAPLLLSLALAGCAAPAGDGPAAETCRAWAGVHLYFASAIPEEDALAAYAEEGFDAAVVDDAEGRRIEATKRWNATVTLHSSLWQGRNASDAPFASLSVEALSEGARGEAAHPDVDVVAGGVAARMRALGGEPKADHRGPIGDVTCAEG